MMSREDWIRQILRVVGEIASRDFQERAWFGIGPEISSPNEIYNSLFDDSTFDLFFEKYAVTLTPRQIKVWNDLKKSLEDYEQDSDKLNDARRVFDDPEWQQVRGAAERFISVFESGPRQGSSHDERG